MRKLIWSTIASIGLQLSWAKPIFIFSIPSNISIPLTSKIMTVSWQEEFEQQKQETEFLDDDTEKLLSRNKKWLILFSVIFIWMVYKSLWSSK